MSRPAVVAGWVGVGVAAIVVIGFELVFAVQAIVFLLALPVGVLVGWYANTRDRSAIFPAAAGTDAGRLGWLRVVANGLIAGIMTAIALAALYVVLRLVFLYLDSGFRAGGAPYACTPGPECGYQRALAEPRLREALEAAGVRDAAGYTIFFLEGQAVGGAALVVLVLAGSLMASAGFALARRSARIETPAD